MIHGSCLCGKVRFELDGAPQFINHCHCSMCRKVHGAAFGSFLHADGRGFRWLSGQSGDEIGEARLALERPDVANLFPHLPQVRQPGFAFETELGRINALS